jgi:hypothetical protein
MHYIKIECHIIHMFTRINLLIVLCKCRACFFFHFISICSLYRWDSLWQIQITLYFALVWLSSHSPSLDPIPAPYKLFARGFIIFHICIQNLSTIFSHLHLIHSNSLLPQELSIHYTYFRVLSSTYNSKVSVTMGFSMYPSYK